MYSRYASPDMALTFFVVYSIYLFIKGSKNPKGGKGFFAAFFAVLGLGTMSKGYVGFLLPLIIVLSFIVSSKKWKLLRSLNLPYGMLIVLTIGLPWYIAMYVLHGDKYFNYMILRDGLQKIFASPNAGANLFYYIPNILLWFLPYSLFLPAALIDAFKSKNTYSLERDSYKLILSYFLGIFVFFSLITVKEYCYLLPLAPAFSLMTARYFINLQERNILFRSAAFNLAYVAVIIIYTLVLSAILYTMQHVYSAKVAIYEYAVVLAPLIMIVPYIRKRNRGTLFAISIAMAIMTLFLAGRAVPLFNDNVLPAFAEEIKKGSKPGDRVGVGSVDISRERLGICLDMPVEEISVKGETADVLQAHREKLKKFLTSGGRVYLVIAEDDYNTLISRGLKSSLVIMDEREMWKTRLKRSLRKDTVRDALKGKKDILKDVLRHRVYLVANKTTVIRKSGD
jgi:4-amino-4-deoxy-L-arabinose transferase-like glycosyltransferase